jgi:hypothetical protein
LAGGTGLADAKKLALVGFISGAPTLILFLTNIFCRMMLLLTVTMAGDAVLNVLRLTIVAPLLTYTFLYTLVTLTWLTFTLAMLTLCRP